MRRFSYSTTALCAALLLLGGNHPSGAQTTNAAQSVTDLRDQIEAHVTADRFRPAVWGIKIVSLDSGRTVYEHHAERLMSPAPNSKLYVGALALDRFGGDYCITTPVLATVPPDERGTLKGNLLITGRGDPSWKLTSGKTNFWQIFDPFVSVLKNAGVRRITGDLIADATYFQGPPHGSSWTVDDLEDSEGAEISALTLLDNCAELRAIPAKVPGLACPLEFRQPHTGIELNNRTTTTAPNVAGQLVMRRIFGEPTLHLFGSLPTGDTNVMLDVPVPRPSDWFGNALKAALARRGIRVEGAVRSVRWPEASPVPAQAVQLGMVVSPPMRELVRAFMKPSQNLETDLIFAHVGESFRTADTPAWRTSEQLAVEALENFLRTNNLPADDLRFDEGSGLSRNNLTTANATVALLQFMTTHREATHFAQALPVAGVDGTLRRRMKGTPAEGNIQAKTGTLRWVNALSGYVTSAAGERFVFSLLLNRNTPPPGRNGREELDAIAVMLAQFAVRSDVESDPTSATGGH